MRYRVTINLNSITYEFNEENEDEAIKKAHDMGLEELTYDLFKWATYDVEEI